jgi:hypothetical protein
VKYTSTYLELPCVDCRQNALQLGLDLQQNARFRSLTGNLGDYLMVAASEGRDRGIELVQAGRGQSSKCGRCSYASDGNADRTCQRSF